MKSFCIKCKTDTNQKILFEHKEYIEEQGGWQEYNYYQIIQCEGCDTCSFRRLHTDIMMNHYHDPEDGPGPYEVELFPNRSIQHLPIKRYSNTPNNISMIYQETINAYNNNQLILCSGGLRAIIEGICNDRGIKGANLQRGEKTLFVANLEGKIEGLAQNGFLTKKSAEILHNLRFIGNDALHELSIPSKAELKLGIDIIEHTIDNLFEIEHKADNLKAKFTERKNA